jgi:multidrug efflux pump subunit AcrA (membrane-fusion protein)
VKNPVFRSVIFFPVLLAMSSCFFLPREEAQLPPPLIEPAEVQYRSVEVERGNIEQSVRAVGNLVSTLQAELSFQERGGYLRRLYVRVGDEVRAGQLLAELETDDIRNLISQEELNIGLYAGQLENLDASAELELALEQISLEELESDYRLHSELGDRPQREMESMAGAIQKQRLRMELMRAGHADRRMALEHSLATSELRLEELRRELAAARLYAPADGLVVFLDTSEEGRYIRAQEAFVRISSPRGLIVQYSGREYQSFSRGMVVSLTIAGGQYRGTVVSTPQDVPAQDYQAYRETVQIRAEGLPEDLGEGTAADISAVISSRENVLVLPKAAVQRFQTRRFVRILENGIIREQDVSLGIESDRFFEITGGLEEGQTVLY